MILSSILSKNDEKCIDLKSLGLVWDFLELFEMKTTSLEVTISEYKTILNMPGTILLAMD